jgi:all-trans-8'-apo-beta-carotenal 15,15'-oxygenase
MPVPTSITTATHQDLDLRLVAGEWPRDLQGEVVVSSPRVAADLPSALFGFGVACRLSLRPGTHGAPPDRFAWRTRVIDTPSQRLHERAAERFTAGPTGYSSPFGFPNAANTAPLPWGDRLFATWDVGRPVEVDPVTLGFLGDVGHRDAWGAPTMDLGGVLPFFFSSAHPVIDPERDCLWTVKLSFAAGGGMQLHVVRWSGDGTEVTHWPVRDGIVFGSSHSISQTRDFLVLADSGNFKTDPGEMAGGPRTVTIDTDAAVYLIRKDQLEATAAGTEVVPQPFRVAPTTGHFYARWDDDDGVRVLFEHLDVMDLGYKLEPGDLDARGRPVEPALVGFYNTAMAPNSCSEVLFDPAIGASKQEALFVHDWTYNLELSAMDWSLEALREPTLHHIAYQGFRPGTVTQRALANYADRVSDLPGEDTPGALVSLRRGSLEEHARWEYHDVGDHITSPAFAPRQDEPTPAGERARYGGDHPGGHEGHVILPVLSDEGFRVEVFDAADVGRGPVAVLAAPGGACVPVLLHSAWMPRAVRSVDRDRLRFAAELDDAVLDAMGPELADIVRSVAVDLDDERG